MDATGSRASGADNRPERRSDSEYAASSHFNGNLATGLEEGARFGSESLNSEDGGMGIMGFGIWISLA
jgi:hypothetical protein